MRQMWKEEFHHAAILILPRMDSPPQNSIFEFGGS
jgi:hypothetical protein